jgi:hypothetical protein
MYVVLSLPFLMYYLLFEYFMNGQTPGKKATGLKVVRINGGSLNFTSCFLRWVFRLIDITLLYGNIAVYSILWTDKKQRLGDLAAGTAVIRINKKTGINDLSGRDVENDYMLKYPESELLTDEIIAALQDVINRYNLYGQTVINNRLLRKSTEKILEKFEKADNEVNKDNESCFAFIENVIKDYNYIYNRE